MRGQMIEASITKDLLLTGLGVVRIMSPDKATICSKTVLYRTYSVDEKSVSAVIFIVGVYNLPAITIISNLFEEQKRSHYQDKEYQ